MFYHNLEKEIERCHIADYENDDITFITRPKEAKGSNVINLFKTSNTEDLIGIRRPDHQQWHALVCRAESVALGSRAFYIALGDWFNSQEDKRDHIRDFNKHKAYLVFRKAIAEFGKDPILLSGVTINMFSIYDRFYSKNWFINDVLDYGKDYSVFKKDDWGGLFYITESLCDLDIYLKRANLTDNRKKIIRLDLQVRERMIELEEGDATNLCQLACDCELLGLTLKQEHYARIARSLAKQGTLADIGFFGDKELVNKEEIEERLQLYLCNP